MIIERETFALPREPAPGTEIFVIGDVHGRSDLLEALLAVAEREPRLEARRELMFLGDLVDRGPDSLGAIRLSLAAPGRVGADACVQLMGNHEAMMRLALDPATPDRPAIAALTTWVRNGGAGVIAEFAPDFAGASGSLALLRFTRSRAPAFVKDWLAALQANARSGGLLFVHAGVHPNADLESFLATPWDTPLEFLVEERHWAWVRGPFLRHLPDRQGFSGYFVVHGHTPNDGWRHADHRDQIRRFRLNLDGGSGMTGACKMGIFRGDEVEVVTAWGPTNGDLGF